MVSYYSIKSYHKNELHPEVISQHSSYPQVDVPIYQRGSGTLLGLGVRKPEYMPIVDRPDFGRQAATDEMLIR